MAQKLTFFKNALLWYSATSVPLHSPSQSVSRDIFQARLDHLFRELLKAKTSEPEAALLVSVLGEIGNNAFDHNIGQWKDQPGCWFEYKIQEKEIHAIIADRGQGFLNSLKRVQKNLQTDQQAIETAFQKIISGRFPERRGNGLKYVRSILNGHPTRGLAVQSGQGFLTLGGHSMIDMWAKILRQHIATGVVALIVWKRK